MMISKFHKFRQVIKSLDSIGLIRENGRKEREGVEGIRVKQKQNKHTCLENE